MQWLTQKLTSAHAVAIVALFFALSGGAFAGALVGSAQIQDNSIQNRDIHKNTITGSRVKDGSLEAKDIKRHTLNGDNLHDRTLTARQVQAGSLTGNELADKTVTTNEIADGTVTADNIASGTITSAEIANGTITGTEVANGSLTGADLTAGTVTNREIAGGTVTSTEIADSTITSDELSSDVKTGLHTKFTVKRLDDGTFNGRNIDSFTRLGAGFYEATFNDDVNRTGCQMATSIFSSTTPGLVTLGGTSADLSVVVIRTFFFDATTGAISQDDAEFDLLILCD